MLGGYRRARLRRTILVTGRDDCSVVFAAAEIDPEFEGQALLAYRCDGKPIEGGALCWWFRLTVTAAAASAT